MGEKSWPIDEEYLAELRRRAATPIEELIPHEDVMRMMIDRFRAAGRDDAADEVEEKLREYLDAIAVRDRDAGEPQP